MKRLYLILAIAVLAAPAVAHEFWSNGEKVPAWTKKWCCGDNDVHRLHPGAVHILADGFHVDGLTTVMPFSKAIPSPDGQYWAFFRNEDGPEAHVSCFYAPLNGA